MQEFMGFSIHKPKVTILHMAPLFTCEYAGRTAYDSFSKSENTDIQAKNIEALKKADIESSDLLEQLSWVHHHESVLEHSSISFLIEGTSRGVLQELARHRIASFTVRSTRYTMSDITNAFLMSWRATRDNHSLGLQFFLDEMRKLDFLVTSNYAFNTIEYTAIYDKLKFYLNEIGTMKFMQLAIPGGIIDDFLGAVDTEDERRLLNSKKKRNVGDAFKFIVTTNFKVDLVLTMNLRSLKNFIKLRLSDAAYWQIKCLASEMYDAIPDKYRRLIKKPKNIKE